MADAAPSEDQAGPSTEPSSAPAKKRKRPVLVTLVAVLAHPGAQLSFTDHEGHRFQCLLTDQAGDDLAALEVRHRAHARVEDSIRCARECGLANLPFREFAPNAVWLELVLTAQDLLAHASSLCLEGGLARAEPKRLRQRVLHVAGRLTRSGRRVTLHLPRRWPWAEALLAAFGRLRSLPLMA